LGHESLTPWSLHYDNAFSNWMLTRSAVGVARNLEPPDIESNFLGDSSNNEVRRYRSGAFLLAV